MLNNLHFLPMALLYTLFSVGSAMGQCTSIKNGNWGDSNTWSCVNPSVNRVPLCADTEIVISEDHTVTITTQQNYSDCDEPLIVLVEGDLTFTSGNKLTLPTGSFIGGNGNVTPPPSGGGNSTWIAIGGTGNNYIEWSASDGPLIGPFQFPASHPLPVELLSFDGYAGFDAVHFEWRVASETNNDFFSIERSTDMVSWAVVHTQPGSGTSSHSLSYHGQDRAPESGLMYYRLSQTDFDGTIEIFDPIAIEFGPNRMRSSHPTLFPNPMRLSKKRALFVQNWNDDLNRIVIADMSGRIIQRIDKYDVSNSSGKIDMDHQLFQQGLYLVTLEGNQKSKTLKLLMH